MRRRTLLGSLVCASVGIAGCVDSGGSTDDAEPTASTNDPTHSPTVGEYDLEYVVRTSNEFGRRATDSPPTVSFHEAGKRVVVAGTLVYGSSSCDHVVVDRLSRTGAGGVELVLTGAPKPDAPASCTDDLAAAGYEVEVTTDGPPIETLTVVERPAHGGTNRWRFSSAGSSAGSPSPTEHPAVRDSDGLSHTLQMERRGNYETDGHPDISILDDGTRVVVESGMRYGSSTCDEIAVSELGWTGEGRLRVAVGASTKEEYGGTCTADIAYADYELEITADGQAVERVVVLETTYDGDHRRKTETATASE